VHERAIVEVAQRRLRRGGDDDDAVEKMRARDGIPSEPAQR